MSDFVGKLRAAQSVTLLDCLKVRFGDGQEGKLRLAVRPEGVGREVKAAERVLTTMHYYSHILSRYPRTDGELDRYGMELREMMSYVVEEGIWPGSDVVADARVGDRLEVVPADTLDGAEEASAVLFRTPMTDDTDLALELPDSVGNDALNLSVVAVYHLVSLDLDEPSIELLDKTLRYFRTYIGEGANYASPAAARSLANRAFREAGGDGA
ncbi:MAG TPA: hypothetical protein ENN51_03075 [candidate division WOR-3 bacterium]|uniref:Uncharacterized protein n=1 Tax=candidate division WOR-3 bacterium TaxID=2052148 RepID=A0A7V0T5F2_UNCW3|nr:hypothetical protein [candidate division WOR-3 bacterium]